MSQEHVRHSEFARWLLRHCLLAGYADDAQTHGSVIIVASIALSDGLSPELIADLARTLAVTEEELTAAYTGEMRERMTAELLDHPDLAALDAQLDMIARSD
ncbi:hypothetical protein [Streptomyces niveus]|uniref:hypothetical protein n=1 Tax=Streptomyces niveus TaxID=193462 RepID=UPI00084C34E2|nr:hypothetical protein [Streptomyces niveus]